MATESVPRMEIKVRENIDQKLLEQLIASGSILVGGGRRRPFYFDGRFLTAQDLTADQEYVRARQSDLAQATGAGVIRGLMVRPGPSASRETADLVLEPGLGITPAGDLVVVGQARTLRLSAIADSQALDAQMGIKLLSSAATNNRSGLFILALRPVEFSTNPVPSYPTQLDGVRGVHDGDIIEATAVTLIPYPDRAGVETPEGKRARVAREIFVDGARPGVLQEALPLAMLYLSGGAIRWLDVHMVRREIGTESTLAAGLAQRPRGLLEAWFRQHLDHVGSIDARTVDQGFPATRYFEVLPPVGLIPAASLRFDTALGQPTLVQSFFPPLVDCEFAFVPSDELAALIDDSLALPPIDLSGADEDLDHLSVLIVAPVTRQQLEDHKRTLSSVSRAVRSAAPGMLAKRLPLEALLRTTVRVPALPADSSQQALGEAWSKALGAAQAAQGRAAGPSRGSFWFVRRRQLPYYAEISSATLRLAGDAAELDKEVDTRLEKDNKAGDFTKLNAVMPRLAVAETVNLLAAPRLAISAALKNAAGLATSDLLRRSALAEVTRFAGADLKTAVSHAQVLGVARRFGDPKLGEGLDAVSQAAVEADRKVLGSEAAGKLISAAGVAPELDVAARALPVAEHARFASRLAAAIRTGKHTEVAALVEKKSG